MEPEAGRPTCRSPCEADGTQESVVSHLLTVIVTTSPIPSMPSTALLEALISSWELTPALRDCAKIVMCDGIGEVNDQRKPNYKQALLPPPSYCFLPRCCFAPRC